MEKITYKQIGEVINKSEAAIKKYQSTQPELLKVLKLGTRAYLNNINEEKLEIFAELCKSIEKDGLNHIHKNK